MQQYPSPSLQLRPPPHAPHAMQVPPELASLRRLRILHLGGNLEEEFDTAAEADAMDAALRPLRTLQVWNWGAKNVRE